MFNKTLNNSDMKQFKRFTKNNKEAFIGFRISDKKDLQLKSLADEYGVNKSLLIREAVNEFLLNHS